MSNVSLFNDASKTNSSHSQGIESKVMEITPLIAREWLDSTDLSIQRKVNTGNVTFLASEIEKGNWKLNGEPIIIDKNNNVIDGIHRLSAVVRANTPICTLVIFGVETNAIHTIDQGKVRSISDVYSISHNAKYSTAAAAAVNVIFQFENGRYGSATKTAGERSSKMSPAEALKFIKRNPGFFAFIEETMQLYNNGDKLIPARVFCGMKWVINRVHPIAADSFFTDLSTGVNVEQDSSVYYLRKKLIQQRTNKDVRKMTGQQVIMLLVKCFNYFTEGVKIGNTIQIPKTMPPINKP